MQAVHYTWHVDNTEHEVRFVPVPGTAGRPYLFGAHPNQREIEVPDYHIMSTPVTQALWTHVMGSNPVASHAPSHPVTDVSWHQITGPGGFLERAQARGIPAAIAGPGWALRLPSETEWEYAARGGPRWRDDLPFSGSQDPDEVAWYGPRWRRADQALVTLLGGRAGWRLACRLRKMLPRHTHTHPVAAKAPNQLGLFDMSGHVWEWCQDVCTDALDALPRDGRPYLGSGVDRRLRGGCHHNWDLHCRVWWRYGIEPDAHDGCIGFRLVLSPA